VCNCCVLMKCVLSSDCCDTTDEYNSGATCQNTCR
jgi:hypothetical protein